MHSHLKVSEQTEGRQIEKRTPGRLPPYKIIIVITTIILILIIIFFERVDKFIVQSNNNNNSNKLQGFETVSHGSRHRSNHTQKNIPSIVAGHQFLQFGYIGPKSGSFPFTVIVTHPGFCFSANVAFTKLPLQEFAVSLWLLLQKTCCWKLFKPLTFTFQGEHWTCCHSRQE